ncbi:MAG TPA: hypothetical protein G4N99_13725 [Thermoflexia bacterium]|nr:hypothetical protein [Thermoflexia bacterium]
MRFPSHRLHLTLGLVAVLIALAVFAPLTQSPHAYAGQGVALPNPASDNAVTAGASLHNPNFDNHIWYYFNERYSYGSLTPYSYMPDDDAAGGPQDWRIWYLDGSIPILTWASQEQEATSTDRAIKSRTYWGSDYRAGVYQVIQNTTPCLTYQFQMHGKFKPGDSGVLHTLKVGIDRDGYYPSDVAVHGFPSTTAWGASHPEYSDYYGSLDVTAEAWGDTITVFTYADADGGEVLWDTGDFQEVTTDLISDPDNPPSPNGINITSVVTTNTTAQINWWTTNSALGQVYYRLLPSGGTPSTLPNKIYLPLIARAGSSWQATTLNKTPVTSHSVTISGLEPGRAYEYIVASRGLSGGQCEAWVSDKEEFTTAP